MTGHEGNVSPIWLFLLIGLAILGTWGPKSNALRLSCLGGIAAIVLFATGTAGAASGSFAPFIIAAAFFSYVGYLLFRTLKR